MHDVIDDGAAQATGRARVLAGGDVEGDRHVGFDEARPHRVELDLVVVQLVGLRRAEQRLARQREVTEAELQATVDLLHRRFDVAGGQRRGGREPIDVGTEVLPGPGVVDLALRVGEIGIVLLLTGIEAEVFEQEHIARLKP